MNNPSIITGFVALLVTYISYRCLKYFFRSFNSLRKTGKHPANTEYIYKGFWLTYEIGKSIVFALTFLFLMIISAGSAMKSLLILFSLIFPFL